MIRNNIAHWPHKLGAAPARKANAPLISFKEFPKETGAKAMQVQVALGKDEFNPPKPQIRSRHRLGSNTYYVAADLRAWWKRYNATLSRTPVIAQVEP